MSGFLRARLRRSRTDGFTLVELLVVISISMVVLLGATAMMVTTQKFVRNSSARNANTTDAAISVQTISRYLQSATAICGADDNAAENTCAFLATGVKDNGEIGAGSTYNDMWFFTNWDIDDTISAAALAGGVGAITISPHAPWRIHLNVASNGDLTAQIYRGSGDMGAVCCNWPASPSQTILLAHNVVATPPSGTSAGAPFSYVKHPTATTPTPVLPWPADGSKVGSQVDQVNLDIVVAHLSNPRAPSTEVKASVPLANLSHDAGEWKTFP